ncbi:hypothetical protein [Mycobacteroides salmoniphilum]|uniref:Uncharacterized protein n=1 Tax=Mycobacteroides salmoniphilum TaxID=404941 RepID=A0A4R8SZQ6_9MYCO|nr:hypothetical protein [Mycobacteroides salmoniphilum]TEA09069.1 hypothetical protein CCUG60884_00237 [Mycobacteroides salmoniphilum]
MTTQPWLVHPNRSELGPNKPGRNGHYRPVRGEGAAALPTETCLVRITLPNSLVDVSDGDGTVTFAGSDWAFVVGAARRFVRKHIDADVLPPFGYFDAGAWWWWDGTTSTESILEGPDRIDYVQEYLQLLFRGVAMSLSETTTSS